MRLEYGFSHLVTAIFVLNVLVLNVLVLNVMRIAVFEAIAFLFWNLTRFLTFPYQKIIFIKKKLINNHHKTKEGTVGKVPNIAS